nr:ribonuclease H-like domain-containing protein [Tanacetum cinerariifolium]
DVEKRFEGNAATKKTKRNLLKQQYENFTASRSEVLDQTFDSLKNLISQLEIHGESISREYVNQKFLRSLSQEWNTHTILWRNKPDIDTLSLDDIYNNLKIYKREVKGTSSSNTNTQNIAFVSLNSTNSINGAVNTAHGVSTVSTQATAGNPQMDLQDKEVIDSGCSRHMTGNMSYPTDYEEIDGGYVAFGGNPRRGKIIGRGTIKTGKLDFENVYFVKELKFNIFSVSQMCDKKNSVLFNDSECIVLSPNFKLTDESQVLLRVSRKNNMYSGDLKNIVSKEGLTRLFAKSTSDESKLWHRRLGHLNFKTMNKLVKGNLNSQDDGFQPSSADGKKVDEDPRQESECKDQEKEDNVNITNNVNAAG